MADFAAGKEAYVTVDGSDKTFDEWSISLSCDKADVSDFDRRSARWLSGLPTSTLTMSGPYDVNALGMQVGEEYEVVLGITSLYGLPITALVLDIRPDAKVRGVVRVAVTGVVNSDWLEDPDIIDL